MPITPVNASGFLQNTPGISDLVYTSGMYMFFGCPILNISQTIGFNGSPSSCQINAIEDKTNGYIFSDINVPLVASVSLPYGGVGASILPDSIDLNPSGYPSTGVSNYFAGIITSYNKDERNINGGQTISIGMSDGKEFLSGIQILLNGFALSQAVSDVDPRITNVDNIIDVFGYFDMGLSSGSNAYGIQASKAIQAIEASSVTILGIYMQFVFTGECFTSIPDFYRLDDQVIDLLSFATKIATDGGSDLVVVPRKVADNALIMELRGIRRTNTDVLTQSEIDDFVSARNDIVDFVRKGRETRLEPNSAIVIGGFRNANYVAWPSQFNLDMHLSPNSSGHLEEDYNKFPSDIKTRLFGGTVNLDSVNTDGSISTVSTSYDVNSGAIFPFWGFTPDDHAYPLIEPVLSLDHLFFGKDDFINGNVKNLLPQLNIQVSGFQVRNVTHTDMFLNGDGEADVRPFAYLADYQLQSASLSGYLRGLPLNTEVLRAALISQDSFEIMYSIHYPDIAEYMQLRGINFESLSDGKTDLTKIDCKPFFSANQSLTQLESEYTAIRNAAGQISKSQMIQLLSPSGDNLVTKKAILTEFYQIVYEHVRKYADENMGSKFIVCLPASPIMQRIFNNQDAPTNPLHPQIEYVLNNYGFWETIPDEFSGLLTNGDPSDQDEQVRRRFMNIEGRFEPMAVINWHPSGNANFNANGINKAMFQGFPVESFRPNKIATGDPQRVYVNIDGLSTPRKRPDLAIVQLPRAIEFDPTDGFRNGSYALALSDDERIITRQGIVKFLNYISLKDENLSKAIATFANNNSLDVTTYKMKVFKEWSKQIYTLFNYPFLFSASTERVMDLEAVIIPLTSTWVTYGPWYKDNADIEAFTKLDIDSSLVPWNFTRNSLSDWQTNLDNAGLEKLARDYCPVDYLDSAVITCAGFPEFNLSDALGFNSNLTGINVDFGIGGIKTNYVFSTYAQKPGTYRKGDYDNVEKARVEFREQLPTNENTNIFEDQTGNVYGTNQFFY